MFGENNQIEKEKLKGLLKTDFKKLKVTIPYFNLMSNLEIGKSYLDLRNKLLSLNDKKASEIIDCFDKILDEDEEGSFIDEVSEVANNSFGFRDSIQRRINGCRNDLMRFIGFFIEEKKEDKEASMKDRLNKRMQDIKDKDKRWKS